MKSSNSRSGDQRPKNAGRDSKNFRFFGGRCRARQTSMRKILCRSQWLQQSRPLMRIKALKRHPQHDCTEFYCLHGQANSSPNTSLSSSNHPTPTGRKHSHSNPPRKRQASIVPRPPRRKTQTNAHNSLRSPLPAPASSP